MTQIELKKMFHYEPTTGVFTRLVKSTNGKFKAGSVAGATTAYGYLAIKIDYKQYRCHALAALYMTGSLPTYPQEEVDHINGITSDNRWSNLRVGDKSMNQRNRRIRHDNTSGATGVQWNKYKSKWEASIRNSGKRIYLGTFIELDDAIQTRKDAEIKYGYKTNYKKVA